MSILYLTHKSLKIRQILKLYIYNFSVKFIVGWKKCPHNNHFYFAFFVKTLDVKTFMFQNF